MEELEFGDRNVPYCHKAHAEVVRLEKKNRPLDAMPALKVNQIKYVKNLKNKQDKAICVVMIENKKYIMKIVRTHPPLFHSSPATYEDH